MGDGILFAIDHTMRTRLGLLKDEESVCEYVFGDIEDLLFDEYPERTCELEDSWEAIHRALTNGEFFFDGFEGVLGYAILGGEVKSCENGSIVVLKRNSTENKTLIKDVASALEALTKAEFEKGYAKINKDEYPDKSKEDCEKAWEYLSDSLPLWKLAADSKKEISILFTARL